MAASIAGSRRTDSELWSRPISVTERSTGPDSSIVIAAGLLGAGIVAGMALNLGPVATIAAAVAIGASLVSPVVGLAVLAFMAPLKPPPTIPAPGFDAAMVGAILLGCIYRLPIDRPRLRFSAPVVVLVAFILLVSISQLPDMLTGWTGTVGHLVGFEYIQLLTSFGAVLATVYVLSNRSPYPVLIMGLAGAALAGAIALVMFRGTFGPFVNLAVASVDGSRALGPFGNPNYLGVFAAIALVSALALAVHARTRVGRYLLLATTCLLAIALAVSLSREALIAVAVGVLVLVVFQSRRLAFILVLVGVPLALIGYPAFVEWRLISESGSASAAAYAATSLSDSARLTALQAGAQMFLASPILGIGFGYYAQMSVVIGGAPFQIAAHNWYVTVLAEEGSIGIFLWLMLLATVVVALRSRPPAAQAMGYAVFGAFAAGSFFLEPPTSFQTMALPAIFLVAALVGRWTRPADPATDLATDPASGQLLAETSALPAAESA
jgi:O-antigen ligase